MKKNKYRYTHTYGALPYIRYTNFVWLSYERKKNGFQWMYFWMIQLQLIHNVGHCYLVQIVQLKKKTLWRKWIIELSKQFYLSTTLAKMLKIFLSCYNLHACARKHLLFIHNNIFPCWLAGIFYGIVNTRGNVYTHWLDDFSFVFLGVWFSMI